MENDSNDTEVIDLPISDNNLKPSIAKDDYPHISTTSNLVPTAAEFIPRKLLQYEMSTNDLYTTTAGSSKSKHLNHDFTSRSWWKQYKPESNKTLNKHFNVRNKWKSIDFKNTFLEKYKFNTDNIFESTSNNENKFRTFERNLQTDDYQRQYFDKGGKNYQTRNIKHSDTSNFSKDKYNNYEKKNKQFHKNGTNKTWFSKRDIEPADSQFNQKERKRNFSDKNNGRNNLHVYSKEGSNINFREKCHKNLNVSIASQRESLKYFLDRGNLECLVCCEFVKTFQPVWSCSECYHVLHLTCISKWALTSKTGDTWRCPACQHSYHDVPNLYRCFCNKVDNPRYNKYDGAHTCGQVCGRLGIHPCVHSCTLLCHPGPCAPCQAMVYRNCACGNTSRLVQCRQTEILLCGKPCNKMLNCQQHVCQTDCHDGECMACEEKVKQDCFCRKETKEVICSIETATIKQYSCSKTCNRKLDCGNHTCQRICHEGDCEPCSLVPNKVLTCPCGKQTLDLGTRTTCMDPIPLCGAVCEKYLNCGSRDLPHKCISLCHEGSCPDCPLETFIRCRCGHMDREIKCILLSTKGNDVRCLKKCTKKNDCGKHKCNQLCCILFEHQCPLPCARMLSCGQHKCDRNCHKGRCFPCWRSSFEELSCECGYSILHPPVPCGSRRPTCNQPCSRQHSCNHPVTHTCHSDAACPPCSVLCSKWCYGKHEMRKTIPCYQEDFSCGRTCGKELSCGRHTCQLPCHKGACSLPGQICNQPCPLPRSSCNHICRAACHEGICPDTPCKEEVVVTCKCKLRSMTRTCSETSSDYRRITTALLASKMADMQRGVNIDYILGNQNGLNFKVLECTEDCRLVERNRRMMIGLQITNPNLSSKLSPRYSDFLKQWAKRDSVFVKNIHDRLTELVKLSKESKQKFRSHSFPVMNKEKRQVVHEMCEQFGVESQAYDPEPNRNVVATAEKEKCWLPSMSVLEVLQRECGQRKVPVPSLNAK